MPTGMRVECPTIECPTDPGDLLFALLLSPTLNEIDRALQAMESDAEREARMVEVIRQVVGTDGYQPEDGAILFQGYLRWKEKQQSELDLTD